MFKKVFQKIKERIKRAEGDKKLDCDSVQPGDIEKIRDAATERMKITYKFLSIVAVGFGTLFLMVYYHYSQSAQLIVEEIAQNQYGKPYFCTMILLSCVMSALFICMLTALQSLAKDGELVRINYNPIKNKHIVVSDLYYASIIPTAIGVVGCIWSCFCTLLTHSTFWIKLLNPDITLYLIATLIVAWVIIDIIALKMENTIAMSIRRIFGLIVVTIFISMCECVSLGIYNFSPNWLIMSNEGVVDFNMNFSEITTIIIASSSFVVSLVALIQTIKQNKKQNNQFLYERRFNVYKLTRNINNCVKNSAVYFTDSENESFLAKDVFCALVNFAPIYKIANGIEDPLAKKNNKYHQDYLKTKQSIEEVANESSLIFDNEFHWISQYISSYIKLVDEVRKYQIWQANFNNRYNPKNPPSLEKVQKEQQQYHHNVLVAWNELKTLNDQADLSRLQKLLKL